MTFQLRLLILALSVVAAFAMLFALAEVVNVALIETHSGAFAAIGADTRAATA